MAKISKKAWENRATPSMHLANPLKAEQPMKYFQVIPQNTCKIVTQQFK